MMAKKRDYKTTQTPKSDYWTHTNCGGCYGNCGMAVRVVDGVAVQVGGEPGSHMGSGGGLCGKGAASIMSLYDPNRIKHPLRRTNPKKGKNEDPKWERISWDEALDTISEKHKAVLRKDPRAALFGGTPSPGTASNIAMVLPGLFLSLGTRNFSPGGVGLHCGNGAHFGAGLIHCSWSILPDFNYCNLAIQFGSNKGTGSGHGSGPSMRLAATARARGMRNIVFDPLCNFGGGKATEWIPILPGTDLAVILSMCNIIVNEVGIYDEEFLRKYTNGPYLVGPEKKFVRDKERQQPMLWDETDTKAKTWDDPTLGQPALLGNFYIDGVECQPAFQIIKEHLKQYNPEWAETISTVPARTTRRIAREFVEEARIGSTIDIEGVKLPYRPVSAVMFRGGQGHSNAFHQYLSMCLMNQLVGNIEAVGGTVSWPARSLGYPGTNRPRYEPSAGYDGMLVPGMWWTSDPWPPEEPKWPERMTLQDLFVHNHVPGYPYADDFERIWDKVGRPYECEVLAIYGGNLAKTTANTETLSRFLSKVPFSWGIFTEHNETTEGFMDIVLPEKHFLEQLNVAMSIAYFFNYPTGMDNWCFHLRQPAVKNRYEERDLVDILFDLADRIGPEIRRGLNGFLDAYFSSKMARQNAAHADKTKPFIIGPDQKISNEEFVDRTLKCLFGPEHDLEWFRNNGYITWKKRPEEAYWRSFVTGRGHLYFEFLEVDRARIPAIAEKLGIHAEWEQYSPLITYFPSVIYTEVNEDSEYDLIAFSYRDILHTGSNSYENPLIDEMSRYNPFTYNIVMNVETARKKGIKDGDLVCVENVKGLAMTGRVKLMRGIHPKVIGSVGGGGGWAKARPIAKGKGVMFNNLLILDQKHLCPITASIETAVRVKIYKTGKEFADGQARVVN
ncbi:MAG: molybdopterin-dependent oxidoreductase [Pseudomonadota bacterium]